MAHLPVFTRLAFRLKLGIIGCPLMRPMLRDGSPYMEVHVLQPDLHRFTSSDRRRIESNTINQLGCRVADVVGRVVVWPGLGPLSGLSAGGSAVTCRVEFVSERLFNPKRQLIKIQHWPFLI